MEPLTASLPEIRDCINVELQRLCHPCSYTHIEGDLFDGARRDLFQLDGQLSGQRRDGMIGEIPILDRCLCYILCAPFFTVFLLFEEDTSSSNMQVIQPKMLHRHVCETSWFLAVVFARLPSLSNNSFASKCTGKCADAVLSLEVSGLFNTVGSLGALKAQTVTQVCLRELPGLSNPGNHSIRTYRYAHRPPGVLLHSVSFHMSVCRKHLVCSCQDSA